MKNIFFASLSIAFMILGACTTENNQVSEKEIITLDNITAGRPYSPAVKIGNVLYVSGQIAVDPESGVLIEGDIEHQTRQVLLNLQALVEKAGFSMRDIVKCNVLMDTISYYAPMNKVYMEFFPENPPARKAYAVESLPLGAMLEIDAIAVK